MRVAVVGQGYVGVTAALCLAEAGHEVIGVENDPRRLDSLRSAQLPIYEPGLPEMLEALHGSPRLRFCSGLSDIDRPLDAVIVAVGSPELPSGGADIRQVTRAFGDIAALPSRPRVVMMKSTVPPGTSTRLLAEGHSAGWLEDHYVVSPEFLSLGSAVTGWRAPARVVVGLQNPALLPVLRDLYRGIEAPWVVTDFTDAEMIKYASNAFLATKISFINEIANLCDEVGADIDNVVAGLAPDPRIGGEYFSAGVGYGGSCFPKDTRALSHVSSLQGHSMPLLEAVIAVNNVQPLRVIRRIREELAGRDMVVAVLGLSFKPGTDDVRQSPSLTVVPELLALGYELRTWDPAVGAEVAGRLFPGTHCAETLESAVDGANAVVILTDWPQLEAARWDELLPTMHSPRLVIDGRNCLDPVALSRSGATYRGVGRRAC